jgi:hypothetical protein
MNPVTVQAIAAQRIADLRAHAADERRARIALSSRGDARDSRARRTMPGLRRRLGRSGTSLTSVAG